MDQYWQAYVEHEGEAHLFDSSRVERVVPAAGDPALEYYRAGGRTAGGPPRYWPRVAGSPVVTRRHHLRGWLTVTVVALLALLVLKPLVALAAIGIAVLIGLLVAAALAIGAVFLVLRIAMGGFAPPARSSWRGARVRPWYRLVRYAMRRR